MSRDLVAEHVGRSGRPRPDGRDPKVVVTRLQIGSRKERGRMTRASKDPLVNETGTEAVCGMT